MGTSNAQPGDTQGSHVLRDRGPIVAVFAVQYGVAAYLGYLKFVADKQLVDGVKYLSPFYQLMATMDWVGAWWGLLFLAVAFLMARRRQIDDLAAWLGRNVLLVAVVAAAGLSAMSVVAHQAYPFTMDEFAPYFQSQVFARGQLAGRWPPQFAPLLVVPEYVDWFIVMSKVTGQTCSDYWPGHAILMTPFTFLGVPWALNPLLSGCAILLLAAVARRSFGDRAAGWAVLFALGSPVFAAYGISFYAMTSHLTLNLLYAWLLLSPTLPRVAGAGLVGGFALALHNPFPHFLFSLPWLGWLTLRRDRWTRLPVIALCYAAVFLPLEVGWRHVEEAIRSDRPATVFAAPAAAEQSPVDVAGQPTAKATTPAAAEGPSGVTAMVGAIRGYFSALNLPTFQGFVSARLLSALRLVAWDAPGLLVLACWGFWRNRHATPARLFALSGLSTFLGYALITMSGGHGWGYRYFFSAWSCLPFLAASLAADRSPGEQTEDPADPNRGDATGNLLRAMGLAAVLSLAICLPVRLWQIHDFIADHLTQMPPKPAGPAASGDVIVSFVEYEEGYFRGDLVRNDPFLKRGPVMLWSQGLDHDKLVIAEIATFMGKDARMTFADDRGSTWLLQSARPQDPAP